jgi:hypothetical protein
MYNGRLILSQILDFVPRREFNQCVTRYNGNYKVQTFSCRDQFIAMMFAQLTGRESLRDIEACLRVMGKKLYHAGLRGDVSRSTLSDANQNRDCRIYEDFAHVLISRARKLYVNEDFGIELEQSAYAIDATTIDLCLSLFPWARFRKKKGGIKLHTLMELKGNIPCVIWVSDAKTHDVAFLDDIDYESGSFYIMDKAYIDFERLYRIDQNQAFFVTRAKMNIDYTRRTHRKVDKTTGLKSDQTIALKGYYTSKKYPDVLRKITFTDPDTKKHFTFLTNNFELDTLIIAQLYKCRWQIERFFKWIKQHLRIKSFFGNTLNAVKTQIWIAISVYVLVAIIKKKLKVERSLYEMLQILSISLFEQMPIEQALTNIKMQNQNEVFRNQLLLFDL